MKIFINIIRGLGFCIGLYAVFLMVQSMFNNVFNLRLNEYISLLFIAISLLTPYSLVEKIKNDIVKLVILVVVLLGYIPAFLFAFFIAFLPIASLENSILYLICLVGLPSIVVVNGVLLLLRIFKKTK